MSIFSKLASKVKAAVQSNPIVQTVTHVVNDVKALVSSAPVTNGINAINKDIKDVGAALTEFGHDVSDVFTGKKTIAAGLKEVVDDAKAAAAEFKSITADISGIVNDKSVQARVADLTGDVKVITEQLSHIKIVGHIMGDLQNLSTTAAVKTAIQNISSDVKNVVSDIGNVVSATKDLVSGKGDIGAGVGNLIKESTDVINDIKGIYGEFKTLSQDKQVAAALTDMSNDVKNEAAAYIKETVSFIRSTGTEIASRVDEIWNSNKVFDTSILGQTNGTAGADTIFSAMGVGKTVDAGAGNDVIVNVLGDVNVKGGAGNDIIYGGVMGTHVLDGGAGDDIIWGGRGQDTMIGGGGKDIYLWGKGDGQDTVIGDQDDKVVVYNMGHDSLSLSMNGNDLVIGADASNTLTIKDWKNGNATNSFVLGGDLGQTYKVVDNNGTMSWAKA